MSSSFSSLSIHLLRVLHTVLQTRNISHAAVKLNASQSLISRQLRQLRDAFGDPLLVRNGREYVYTPRAQNLIEPLNKLIADLDALITPTRFDPVECRQRFRIASSDYVAEYMLPALMEHLASVAPHVAVDYLAWKPNDYKQLANGEIDLVTTMLDVEPAEVHGRTLGNDRPVCMMANNHPLAGMPLTAQAYAAADHIRITGGGDKDGFVERKLKVLGLQRNILLNVPFFSAAMEVASRRPALLTIPEHIAVNLSRFYPMTWQPLDFINHRHHYWTIWHERTHNAAEHKWFRDTVHEIWKLSSYGIPADA
ncbi:LysR family transcriptional regulator [Pseudomonas yamanorum]|nr:LysR family transcriptional regulator [Pseudomonas yamanorum]